jgi:hypothetical protein
VAGSEGGWAACDECHGLIEYGNWTGLAYRSWAALERNYPEVKPHKRQLAANLVTLHKEFARNRTGSPRPFTVQ